MEPDALAQGHLAVEVLDGGFGVPRISLWATSAIDKENFVAASQAAMRWHLNKPYLITLARSMDPADRQVAQAQALLDDMAPLEAQLPDAFEMMFSGAEAERGRTRWLQRIGRATERSDEAAAASVEVPPLRSPLRPENEQFDRWNLLAAGAIGIVGIAWAETQRDSSDPLARIPAEIIHDLVTSSQYTRGFAIGGAEGAWSALKDNAQIAVDLYDVIKDLVTSKIEGGDLAVLRELRDKVMDLIGAGRQVPAAIKALADRWNDSSDLGAQGQFQGHVCGYIAVQVLALVLGAVTPGGQYADVIRILKLATDPLGGLVELGTAAKATRAAKAAGIAEHAAQGAVAGERTGVTSERARDHVARGAAAADGQLGRVFDDFDSPARTSERTTNATSDAASDHRSGDGAALVDIEQSTHTISASRAAEINYGVRDISRRQQNILTELPEAGSRLIDHKRRIHISDLADLTAKTGDEFTIFTRGPQRLIIRGYDEGVSITIRELEELRDAGWRWSGHTHPGTSDLVLDASGSPGDRMVLEIMGQNRSLIMNSRGSRNVFDQADNMRISESGSR